jgi:hypothetical protein
MKTAEYETENSYSICPILEDVDLDAMSDEELREELSNWSMSLSDGDPMSFDVDRNYRLVERHLELRAMTDEALAEGLKRARSAIKHLSKKVDDTLAARNIQAWTVDAEGCAREMRRRGIQESA